MPGISSACPSRRCAFSSPLQLLVCTFEGRYSEKRKGRPSAQDIIGHLRTYDRCLQTRSTGRVSALDMPEA